jgi:hypothetical protein
MHGHPGHHRYLTLASGTDVLPRAVVAVMHKWHSDRTNGDGTFIWVEHGLEEEAEGQVGGGIERERRVLSQNTIYHDQHTHLH